LEGVGCSLTEVPAHVFVYSNVSKTRGPWKKFGRTASIFKVKTIYTPINIRFIFILKVMRLYMLTTFHSRSFQNSKNISFNIGVARRRK
jgi:hypothetical protein